LLLSPLRHRLASQRLLIVDEVGSDTDGFDLRRGVGALLVSSFLQFALG
jgi:hypothetical protein